MKNMKKTTILVMMIMILAISALSAYAIELGDTHVKVRDTSDWDLYVRDNALINQDPDPAEPGSIVELRFKIENIGIDKADDAIFELMPEYPFSLYYPEDGIIEIGEIYARQVGDDAFVLNYKVRVDQNAVEGLNQVRLKYSLDSGLNWVIAGPFDVRVRTYDAILYINSITADPEMVAPGSTTDLTLNLENIADTPLKNVKVELGLITIDTSSASLTGAPTYAELPLAPVGSSNEQVLRNIDGKTTKEVTFSLIADPDAEANVYKVPVSITYNDHLGNEYSKDVVISIVIGQKPDMSITVDSSEIKKEGQSGVVTIKFVNKGCCEVKFLDVTLKESDKFSIFSNEEVYIGNIDSDDYETIDYTLYLKEDGSSVALPLHLEYMDTNNNKFTEDIEVPLKLYSDKEIKMMQPEGNSFVGLFIVIIIVVAGLLIYRWRKKKKQAKK